MTAAPAAPPGLDREAVLARLPVPPGVSPGTLADRLDSLVALLTDWRTRINLVGATTLPDVWHRHILDSAQLVPLLPPASRILDLGSGAGFPGLILALLGPAPVTLVESDGRKAGFLREAIRLLDLPADVIAERIEALPPLAPMPAGVPAITARAFAPLPRLLDRAAGQIGTATVLVLPKGRRAPDELTAARKDWTMAVEQFPSVTDPTASVLRLSAVRRRHGRLARAR